METQLKKGVLDLCILTILSKKDYYGYELVEYISKNLKTSEGTIYPILRRLKIEGYLETYLKESKKGPSRKYYSLTEEGKLRKDELNKEWTNFKIKIEKVLK